MISGNLDFGRIVAALAMVTAALFVLSGQVSWRFAHHVRRAAITVFGAVFIAVLIYCGLWLLGVAF